MAATVGCGAADEDATLTTSAAKERASVKPRTGNSRTSATSGASTRASTAVPAAVKRFKSVRQARKVGKPTRLRIPDLSVDTALERLGQQADKTIEVPRDWQRAGWYRDGPRPGEAGPAVILGHVDSPQGDAVFTGLADVKEGTRIFIDRGDESTATFLVTRVEEHLQAKFPTEKVYLPTLDRELRLITCGGRYIKARGGYQSNVIVFATKFS